MIVTAAIYDQSSGQILRRVSCPDSVVDLQVLDGEDWVQGSGDDVTHYVSDGILQERPEMPVTQSGQTLTVPPGTEYEVRGPAFAAGTADATGTLEFEFSDPGEYTVELRLFPYLDAEVTFHAD